MRSTDCFPVILSDFSWALTERTVGRLKIPGKHGQGVGIQGWVELDISARYACPDNCSAEYTSPVCNLVFSLL